jgi:hypothetical protein
LISQASYNSCQIIHIDTIHPKQFFLDWKVSFSKLAQSLILIKPLGSDPETIETGTIPSRYDSILENKVLLLGGHHGIQYDMERDMLWRWDQVLKTHPNGMRFSVFGEEGDLLATNEYFSVGGGFVVNEKTKGMKFYFQLWSCHNDATGSGREFILQGS